LPSGPDTKRCTLRTGTLLSRDEALLLSSLDKMAEENAAHTLVSLWRRGGDWSGRLVEWSSGTVCHAQIPVSQGVLVGEDGQFFAWGHGPGIEGRVAEKGVFSAVSAVEGRAYAVGIGGIIYRWDAPNAWTNLKLGVPGEVTFEAFAGFSKSEMYAVGWRGELWRLTENYGERLHSPTNLILSSVCCAGDGLVYCCGQKGTLLRGRDDRWELLNDGDTTEDLWSVHWFQDCLYVASMRFLYKLIGNRLERVRFGPDVPGSFYHVTSFSDAVLWSIGAKDVMEFDGASWTRII
jgi:hypothetical protein